MDSTFAFYCDIDDPEDTSAVKKAFCVLSEVHANFRTKTIVAVFECWRSQEAYASNKKPFSLIDIPLEPENGGKLYYQKFGDDGANLNLAKNLRDFCLEHIDRLKTATPAELKNE